MVVNDILNLDGKILDNDKINSLTLELFTSVVKESDASGYTFADGFVYPNSAGDVSDVVKTHVKKHVITNAKMRQTFLKTWSQDSTFWQDMVKYIGGVYSLGYGSVGTYTFPEDMDWATQGTKLFVVGVLTPSEICEKILSLFASGVAMNRSTIEKMLSLINLLGYQWTGDEVIKNKEAVVLLADKHNVLPKNVDMFLRFLIYKANETTLLIRNSESVSALSTLDAAAYFRAYNKAYGNFNMLASGFLRNKKLFLALKRANTATYINKISKLAKRYHRPMPKNPMNNLGDVRVTFDHLEKATPFAIFRALNYCYNRLHNFGEKRCLTYKIRNGKIKTVIADSAKFLENSNLKANQTTIVSFIQKNMGGKLAGKKVFIPSGVEYALPTSEKKMIGGVPFGTKISADDMLCAGVYWEEDWGAYDFDLSAITPFERIAWNSKWDGALQYSGDVTNAPNGASEYIVNKTAINDPVLLINNRFNGDEDAEFQISVGRSTDASMKKGFMMSEDRMLFQSPRIKSTSKQMFVGAFIPSVKGSGKYEYVVFALRAGSSRVSISSPDKVVELKSIVQEYSVQVTLNWLLMSLGAEIVSNV